MKFAVALNVKPTSSFPLGAEDEISVGRITSCGVTWLEAVDGEEVPLIFVAVTVIGLFAIVALIVDDSRLYNSVLHFEKK
jgi:hypothetical protein